MRTRAAVVREPGRLTIEEIELDPPGDGEVLVAMKAAGVCHSDLHTLRGELRMQPPLVLGHEGAGVVEAVGTGITRVAPGDHVMVNWLPADETCPSCLRGQPNLCQRFASTTFAGKLLDGTSRMRTDDDVELKHYLTASTMSERMVLMEDSMIPISDDTPFDVAAITACAVVTGVGAVINTAKVPAGSSAAVIGCGGIGLSMVQGCQLAGCNPIIAVDVLPEKLAWATELGATHTVDASQADPVAALQELTGGGPDYVFDSVGSAGTISQALSATRPGGEAVIAGLHSVMSEVSVFAASLILQNKTLRGSFAGSLRPRVDLPMLIDMWKAGRLQTDKLITKTYALDELAQAFEDMEAGRVARGVIAFDS
ncbi:MAG: Zn-dependent alcohol dehydrogenase [Acidimicrobiia bacterium]|nr:Zn-dependent alcohol dehydrogenase [Acidimicrobiia bacterium]